MANKKTPIHFEKAKGLDKSKFSNTIADQVIAEIQKQRKEQGLPPLKDE